MLLHPLYLLIILYYYTIQIIGIRVTGKWTPTKEPLKFIAKFGFQQLDPLDIPNSMGFVYGNITTKEINENINSEYLLTIVPETKIYSFLNIKDSKVDNTFCSNLLKDISNIAFDSRCFTNGSRGDIFRWVPCPKDKLCIDEDDPKKVLPNYQMTFRIREPVTPEFWYILGISCHLNENCKWIQSTNKKLIDIKYDIWLTNGNPNLRWSNIFRLQLSFDKQRLEDIYGISLFIYIILFVIQRQSLENKGRLNKASIYYKILYNSIICHLISFFLSTLNISSIAWNGNSIEIAIFLSKIFQIVAISYISLFMVKFAQEWRIHISKPKGLSLVTRKIWLILTGISIILYFIKYFLFTTNIYTPGEFETYPDCGLILIRCFYTVWFLYEIRFYIESVTELNQASFLAHFGASTLVWFVYYPIFGVFSHLIAEFWRSKIVVGITTFADTVCVGCLVNFLYQNNSQERILQASLPIDIILSQRTDSLDSADKILLDDYEEDNGGEGII
uniref:GpcrRhopsn4 domain-containing protein n=1 Tax=Strongyloides papillosus TaxID=174720 RepID=A0A0N5B7G3_STREA